MPHTKPATARGAQALGAQARQDWRTQAACSGRPELVKGGHGENRRLAICFGCPVLAPCRSWALSLPEWGETDDIAGGLTVRQRRAWRRRAARTRPARPSGTEEAA